MRFIVDREIYKHLERIVDSFEDVANEIDGIVIDHAGDARARLPAAGRADPGRAGVRFSQRAARCRQFDRHGRRDAAARPVKAVAFAAFFNFAAYFLTLAFPALHKVADTIGKGLIDKDLVTPAVVFGALVGAMFWNVVTWLKGIPSSSSHALIGGLVGAGVAHAGLTGIQWSGLNKTLIAIVLSPTLGMVLAMLIMLRHQLDDAPGDRARGRKALPVPPPGLLGRLFDSATASTMRRRRWGSSPCCSTRPAISAANSRCRTGWRSAATSRSGSAR